jgi:hypothetical protein
MKEDDQEEHFYHKQGEQKPHRPTTTANAHELELLQRRKSTLAKSQAQKSQDKEVHFEVETETDFKLTINDDREELDDSFERDADIPYSNLLMTMKTGTDAESFGSRDFDLTNEMNTTGGMTADKSAHVVHIQWQPDPQGPEMMGYSLPMNDDFFPDGVYEITSAHPSNVQIYTEQGEWESEVTRGIYNHETKPILLKLE